MKKCLIFNLLLMCCALVSAQRDIKIMSYNLLIYPEGEMVNRIDTFSDILEFYQPDLLLVQELKSEQGLQDITQELNVLFGDYQAGTYVPQVSNPTSSWRLQQNLIYNEAVFELVEEEVIETLHRDINYFQLQILEEDGSSSTEILHTYVLHLKSSQGSSNEQLRLAMTEVLIEHIALLAPESNIVVAGDFNVYSSGEPAYQLMVSETGSNTLNDPINMPGWAANNFPNKDILTQSTRLSSLADGSGGGVDDRFDFIMLSDQLMKSNTKLDYKSESYKALGNNGTCYNQDLLDCSTTDNVPFEILRSLYHMSDHLPIVLNLDINETVSTSELPISAQSQLIGITPNPASDEIVLHWSGSSPIDLSIFNLQGKLMLEQKLLQQKERINIANLPEGMYILQIRNKSTGLVEARKMMIQR